MKRRIIFLATTLLTTMFFFIAAKVGFMLSNMAEQDYSAGDVIEVIFHGLSLDFSTSLYVFSLPLLLSIVSIWLKLPRWIWNTYFAIIALAMSLAFVADSSLYSFWHFKLDASCLQYLSSPTEAAANVSAGYLLLRLLAVIVIALGIYTVYAWQTAHLLPAKQASTIGKTVHSLILFLLIPLVVIGIRGGLDESTTNIGQVYFSRNQFLNHAAVNPVFSFLSSIGKSGNYIVQYDYYSDDECEQLTTGLFSTESISPDTLLRTTRPNIVFIVMESCGGQFTEIGGHNEIMPRLNQLAHESVYFTECYANSWRTDKGLVSILSGYPAFPITSVMKIPEKSRKLPSIASSLQQVGYATSFLYGGDINFTNMRSYVMGTGYEQLTWKADFSYDQQHSAKWGVRDDLMLSQLLQEIKQEQSAHWMKTLLTLSSHEPWDVPTKELDDEVYNAFHYLDTSLGQFIDSLRQLPAWDNLLLVILPDHGYRYKGIDETTRLYNHIPMIWSGGAINKPQNIEAICNQSDLAATLLGQMGINHEQFTFSRDVMSSNYQKPVAYHTYNNGVTIIDSTGFMSYDLDAEKMVISEGENAQQQLQLGRALLQLTSNDLVQK